MASVSSSLSYELKTLFRMRVLGFGTWASRGKKARAIKMNRLNEGKRFQIDLNDSLDTDRLVYRPLLPLHPTRKRSRTPDNSKTLVTFKPSAC
jgi:hypothetical protein